MTQEFPFTCQFKEIYADLKRFADLMFHVSFCIFLLTHTTETAVSSDGQHRSFALEVKKVKKNVHLGRKCLLTKTSICGVALLCSCSVSIFLTGYLKQSALQMKRRCQKVCWKSVQWWQGNVQQSSARCRSCLQKQTVLFTMSEGYDHTIHGKKHKNNIFEIIFTTKQSVHNLRGINFYLERWPWRQMGW